MRKLTTSAAIIVLSALLQGCSTPAISHYPPFAVPIDPNSLNFEHIDRGTDTAAAVTIVGLRRVERGVHVVFAVDTTPSYDQSHDSNSLALMLEFLAPVAIELTSDEGDPIHLGERRTEIHVPPPVNENAHPWYCLRSTVHERVHYYETRFTTTRTLPEGVY